MKHLILASTALFLVACGAEPGSEKWCAEKEEQSKTEWSAADAGTYTIAFLRRYPDLKAVLFDLPGVIPLAGTRMAKGRSVVVCQ